MCKQDRRVVRKIIHRKKMGEKNGDSFFIWKKKSGGGGGRRERD